MAEQVQVIQATPEQLKKLKMQGALSQKFSQYSPELQALEMRKFLMSEMNDALGDLSEEAIAATAMARTLNAHVIALPGTLDFCNQMMSLSRSRKRLGRIEGCGLADKPVQPQPVPHDRDIEESRRYHEALGDSTPWYKRMLGFGGR